MSTRKLLAKKMLIDTKKSDGRSPQVQLKSSLTFSCALGKPSSSRSNFLDLDSNIPTPWPQPLPNSRLRKATQVSTRVSCHFGLDKCPIPSLSSSLLNGSSNSSMTTSSLWVKKTTPSQLNCQSPLPPVTWLVSSAPSFPTLLTQSWANSTVKVKARDQLDQRLLPFTSKSDSVDCGLVSWQESSWSVPWLVSNGGSTTPSRLQSAFKQPVEEAKKLDLLQCHLDFKIL